MYDLHYGKGDTYGVNSFDRVCVSKEKDHCADDFSFMNVLSSYNLGELHATGLVGLGPKKTDNRADLFVEKMKEVGVIDEAVFSLYINLKADRSKMTFGGYDLHRFGHAG